MAVSASNSGSRTTKPAGTSTTSAATAGAGGARGAPRAARRPRRTRPPATHWRAPRSRVPVTTGPAMSAQARGSGPTSSGRGRSQEEAALVAVGRSLHEGQTDLGREGDQRHDQRPAAGQRGEDRAGAEHGRQHARHDAEGSQDPHHRQADGRRDEHGHEADRPARPQRRPATTSAMGLLRSVEGLADSGRRRGGATGARPPATATGSGSGSPRPTRFAEGLPDWPTWGLPGFPGPPPGRVRRGERRHRRGGWPAGWRHHGRGQPAAPRRGAPPPTSCCRALPELPAIPSLPNRSRGRGDAGAGGRRHPRRVDRADGDLAGRSAPRRPAGRRSSPTSTTMRSVACGPSSRSPPVARVPSSGS